MIEAYPTYLNEPSVCLTKSVSTCVDCLLRETVHILTDFESSEREFDSNIADDSSNAAPQAANRSEAIPVSEIILSAHLSLVLIGLARAAKNMNYLDSRASSVDITSRLPKQSWWLCIRVLKAFIVLQDKVRLKYILFYIVLLTDFRLESCYKIVLCLY